MDLNSHSKKAVLPEPEPVFWSVGNNVDGSGCNLSKKKAILVLVLSMISEQFIKINMIQKR